MAFNSDYLNYLQRIGIDKTPTDTGAITPIARKMIRINGYGRLEKQPMRDPSKQVMMPSEDILYGLFQNEIPVALYIQSTPGSLDVNIGSWAPSNEINAFATEALLQERVDIIKGMLECSYPATAISDVKEDQFNAEMTSLFTQAGIVMGNPSLKPLDGLDGSLQIDRLIRGLSTVNWGYLVLAQPVKEKATNNLRLSVINEKKSVQDEIKSTQLASPLAEYYTKILDALLDSLTYGLQCGTWRTAVYLFGDKKSYNRVSSIFSGVYTGDQSLPEPISIVSTPAILPLAINWQLPETAEKRGPGLYHHPLKYQSLLHSMQLCSYVHLPNIENNGFAINILPNFDVIPHKASTNKTISIGKIVSRSRSLDTVYNSQSYEIDLHDLMGHAFISGITGAGKTNTILQILQKAYAHHIPFLVIEPAKKEYRSLLNQTDHNLSSNLQIFTPGNELISPFRLNPFEIVSWPHTSVSLHIDMLRSVFSASFGMWAPLPQILEQCIYAIYADSGWDIVNNKNSRINPDEDSDITPAFPTLSDLAQKVEEAIRNLGYEKTITDNMKAALLTRINGLRIGGKGKMLDVQRSLPMKSILDYPTVFELEGMGDDDDKAFFMGLIFIRIAEYRSAQGSKLELEHLLVIEEAHRLLTNVNTQARQEESNPKGKAVETFSNILSEIRTYGQGVIIADQVPVRLAPDAIKNTNLKIAHRCVASDDRAVLAGAMSMSEPQSVSVASFERGVAAVFGRGDDAPLLVHVDEVPSERRIWPSNEKVKNSIEKSDHFKKYRSYFSGDNVPDSFSRTINPQELAAAKLISESSAFGRHFRRFMLFSMEDERSADSCWDNLLAIAPSFLKEGMDLKVVTECAVLMQCKYYAEEKGREENWPYTSVTDLTNCLCKLANAKLTNAGYDNLLQQCREKFNALFHRSFEPYAGCNKICTQGSPVCLYRRTVADYLANVSANLNDELTNAYLEDKSHTATDAHQLSQHGMPATLRFLNNGSYTILDTGFTDSIVGTRTGLCYAQQIFKDRPPGTHHLLIDTVLEAVTES